MNASSALSGSECAAKISVAEAKPEVRLSEVSGKESKIHENALNTEINSFLNDGLTFDQIQERVGDHSQLQYTNLESIPESNASPFETRQSEVQIAQNREDGMRREAQVFDSLKSEYPESDGFRVLEERYLLHENGEFASDPETGGRRRLDFVVADGSGEACRVLEVTSPVAPKELQSAKESRIREAGGTFVRDPETQRLVNVALIPTEIIRIP